MASASPRTPFEEASLNQRSEYVRDALAQLPEKQRQVLEMSYYEGMSQSEIAKQLEAVCKRLLSCRLRFC